MTNTRLTLQQEKQWTTCYVIESFAYELATYTDYLVNEHGEYIAGRFYYEQARDLQYKIPVYRPRPTFKIYLSHLSDELKHELESYSNDRKSLSYVLKQSVGRIFEDIDSRQYHISVSSILEVELI